MRYAQRKFFNSLANYNIPLFGSKDDLSKETLLECVENDDFRQLFLFSTHMNESMILLKVSSIPAIDKQVFQEMIDSAKSHLLKFVNDRNEKEFRILNTQFIQTYMDIFEKRHQKIHHSYSKSMKKHKGVVGFIMTSEFQKEVFNHKTFEFGEKLNDIALIFHTSKLMIEYLLKSEDLLKTEKRQNFYFWLSIGLASASIIISIFSIIR